jgi:predicted ATPase
MAPSNHSPQGQEPSPTGKREGLEQIFARYVIPEGTPDLFASRLGQLFPEIVTDRIVLTGPPSSGKTTTADFLSELGVATLPEAARLVLCAASARGYEVDEIFAPDVLVARQTAILNAGLSQELPIDPAERRVMDRSCLDVIPFSQALGMDVSSWMRYANLLRYRKIIYLEPLPLKADTERPADQKAEELRKRVDEVSRRFWESLGYQVHYVSAVDSRGEVLSYGTRLGLVAKALGFGPWSIWSNHP